MKHLALTLHCNFKKISVYILLLHFKGPYWSKVKMIPTRGGSRSSNTTCSLRSDTASNLVTIKKKKHQFNYYVFTLIFAVQIFLTSEIQSIWNIYSKVTPSRFLKASIHDRAKTLISICSFFLSLERKISFQSNSSFV